MRCVGAAVCSCVVYIRGRGCDQEQPVVMDDAAMVVDEEGKLEDEEQPPQLLLTLPENNENFTPEIFKECLELSCIQELSEDSKCICSFFFASIVMHSIDTNILIAYMGNNKKKEEEIKKAIGAEITQKGEENLFQDLNIFLKIFLQTIWSNLQESYFQELCDILNDFVNMNYRGDDTVLFHEIIDSCYSFLKCMKTCNEDGQDKELFVQDVFRHVLNEEENEKINTLLLDWQEKSKNQTMEKFIEDAKNTEEYEMLILGCVPWIEIKSEGHTERPYLNFLGLEISMQTEQNNSLILQQNSMFKAKEEMENGSPDQDGEEPSDSSLNDKPLDDETFNANFREVLKENADGDADKEQYLFRKYWVKTTRKGIELSAGVTKEIMESAFSTKFEIDLITKKKMEDDNSDIQKAMQTTNQEVVIVVDKHSYISPVYFLYNIKLIEKISKSGFDDPVKRKMYYYMLRKITENHKPKIVHEQSLIDALTLLIEKIKSTEEIKTDDEQSLQNKAVTILEQYNRDQSKKEEPVTSKQKDSSKIYDLVVMFWGDIINDQKNAADVVETIMKAYNTRTNT